ncbi:MAG: hypothetical protein H0W68_11190 [Gemmatimonadaceae bacterium]|nr:hypothetical protein [Gemmatimonadaceae bacterium]
MTEPPLLPELLRSLRAFGEGDDTAAVQAYEAVCEPLVRARGIAARAEDRPAVRAALHGAALTEEILRRVTIILSEGSRSDPERRAASARAREIVEPLALALRRTDAVSASGHGAEEWESWIASLRVAFGRAGEVRRALAVAVAASSDARAASRRRFGRPW